MYGLCVSFCTGFVYFIHYALSRSSSNMNVTQHRCLLGIYSYKNLPFTFQASILDAYIDVSVDLDHTGVMCIANAILRSNQMDRFNYNAKNDKLPFLYVKVYDIITIHLKSMLYNSISSNYSYTNQFKLLGYTNV